MKEVLDPKTSLENTNPKKWNREIRSTRSENLFGELESEEESRAGGEKNRERRSTSVGKVNGRTRVLKPWVPSGFFSTSAAITCNSSLKILSSILELEF